MAIMPPDTPLWHEVVAEEGLQAVWPLDSEDSARQLQAAWQRIADDVGEGGFQVSQAAGVVESSWPDPAGNEAVGAVRAYFDRIKEVALQLAWTGMHPLSYANRIEQAKNAVRDTIAGWERAYAAAGVPRWGKDTVYEQSLVVFHAAQACFKIIDDATRDLQNTLVQQAIDEENQSNRGMLDAGRQLGNLGQLGKVMSGNLNRWGILTPATAIKTADDVDNGEPVDQAIASNWLAWGANVGTGALLTAAGVIAPVGMLGGLTAAAFTSGAVDSMYENGPTHLGTALARGGERVVDTYQGIGSALRDAVDGDEARPSGQGG